MIPGGRWPGPRAPCHPDVVVERRMAPKYHLGMSSSKMAAAGVPDRRKFESFLIAIPVSICTSQVSPTHRPRR
jgi:hypothetical protein